MAAKKKRKPGAAIAQNRKARRDYAIIETFEAGIMLLGTEVKSLRAGRANIAESYARTEAFREWLWSEKRFHGPCTACTASKVL